LGALFTPLVGVVNAHLVRQHRYSGVKPVWGDLSKDFPFRQRGVRLL